MKRVFYSVFLSFLALICAGFFCVSCAGQRREETFFALDTYNTITVYGAADSIQKAREMLESMEKKLSNTDPDSEICAINVRAGEAVEVSEECAALIGDAIRFSRLTDGAFDPTVAPVVAAYGFYDGAHRAPDEAELSDAKARVDYRLVSVSGRRVTLAPGQELDLGAIAKGCLGDLCARVLRENGADSGIVSLGGNVCAFGKKPDGNLFSVAVTDPIDPSGYLGYVRMTDASLVTAGAYQRNFTLDGKFYHHIIDPRTGLCADSGLASVSVLCASGEKADALSTACFVLGEEKALELWRNEGDFDLILVRSDGTIVLTGALFDRFTSASETGRKILRIDR